MTWTEEKSPGGKFHPQFVLDYIAAFKLCNPDRQVPRVWDKQNGWIHFDNMPSMRASRLQEMTRVLLKRAAK